MTADKKPRSIMRDWRLAKKNRRLLARILSKRTKCEKRILILAEKNKQVVFRKNMINTSVDSLAIMKAGINTKALRASGYYNIWQLQNVSRERLMQCKGIGSVGADKIIRGVLIIKRNIYNDSKVDLTMEAASSYSNRLVGEIYFWRACDELWSKAELLMRGYEAKCSEYKKQFGYIIYGFKIIVGAIRWALINEEDRRKTLEKASSAHQELSEYWRKISELECAVREKSLSKSSGSFMDDYKKNAEEYVAVVENVTGGRYMATSNENAAIARFDGAGANSEYDEANSLAIDYQYKKMPLNFRPTRYRGDMSTMTELQKKALEAMANGENVFLTGGAGTGKSFVLKKFLEMRNGGRRIVACAPTGIAALNLEWGVTIHKAFGVPVGEIADYRHLSKSIYGPKDYVKNADVIVIDEISMCPIDVFDFIMEQLHKIESKRRKKFQIVVCGDFYQLPPVMAGKKKELLKKIYPDMRSGFCFESNNWSKLNFTTFNLIEVIRQKDAELIRMLNKARIGDDSCLDYFNKKVVNENYESNDDVILSSRNSVVDKINKEKLEAIKSEPMSYIIKTEGEVPLSRITFVEELTLKNSARVMALTNDNVDHMYVNGSVGTVMALYSDHVRVRWDNGAVSDVYEETVELKEPDYRNGTFTADVVGVYSQIPLKLCYAITIHKSQGQSIEKCLIYPHSFEKGQLYVAMSRCTNPDYLHFASPIKGTYLRTSSAVGEFYDNCFKQR